MAQTILLSKVFGVFIFVVGMTVALQRQAFASLVSAYARDRLLRVVVSAIELLGALFLVMLHNDWSSAPAVIISIFGWMALIESIVYLCIPNSIAEALIDPINVPAVYLIGGLLAAALGLYLAAYGFGVVR